MKQIIVTVGREHGSGGKYIAEQIAKQLGIAFYDKELLLDSVFNAEDAARYDEKPVHLLWSRRIGENFNAPEDALAHETFDYIQKLADSGESFVVLGRCSDFILRSNPNAVHLFIAGKPDQKRQRLMEEKSSRPIRRRWKYAASTATARPTTTTTATRSGATRAAMTSSSTAASSASRKPLTRS